MYKNYLTILSCEKSDIWINLLERLILANKEARPKRRAPPVLIDLKF